MKLRFRMRVQHSSVIDTDEGHFICEFEGNHLKSGVFHFSGYGEVAMSEVQRLLETSHLTKGLRLRERQVRFVCVLKRKGVAADSEHGEDDDDPYICATIETNGWRFINAIIDEQEVFLHV